MKRIVIISGLLFVISLFSVYTPKKAVAEESKLSIPVLVMYSSLYWWRGVELNNTESPSDSVGIVWSGFAIKYAGFSILCAGGFSEDLWRRRNTEDLEDPEVEDETEEDAIGNNQDDSSRDTAKTKTEVDYGISYKLEIKPVKIAASVLYVQYPYFDEMDNSHLDDDPTVDSTDPSFWEAGLSLDVDTILSPSVEFYWDYYVEDYKNDKGEDVPVDEDYYVKLSVSQEIVGKKDVYSLAMGAWAGYYNNAYMELKGWSDAGGSLEISVDHESLSIFATVYYARTLDKDFVEAAGFVKNHTWCDFGITYKIL